MIEETSEAISAELRELSKSAKYCELQPKVSGKPIGIYFSELADRIEAAGKREHAEIEANAIAHTTSHMDAVHRDDCRDCVYREPGNAAAMRDACVAVSQAFDDALICTDYQMTDAEMDRLEDVRRKVKFVLAAPSRNCDIGTVDEIRSRLRDYCRSHLCGKCPFDKETDEIDDNHSCVIRWLLSPAKEGGAT